MAASVALGITLEQFASLSADGAQHEVSAGELITMPPAKSLHTKIGIIILEALQVYLHGRNWKALPEAGYLLSSSPLTIRQPDVSVLAKERYQSARDDSYFEGAPEVAIEVISPFNDADDIELKIAQYLRYGAMQVWVLYPVTQQVHVFRADGSATILNASQTLDGDSVLPGFSIAVRELFAL
jgi:Uma2 family endonuclease